MAKFYSLYSFQFPIIFISSLFNRAYIDNYIVIMNEKFMKIIWRDFLIKQE